MKKCKIIKASEAFRTYMIPVQKVINRLNWLEAEGFTTDEACEIIAQEIREKKL